MTRVRCWTSYAAVLAPLPRAPVPRSSRPQPRTPQPRWSRRHSGVLRGGQRLGARAPRLLLEAERLERGGAEQAADVLGAEGRARRGHDPYRAAFSTAP